MWTDPDFFVNIQSHAEAILRMGSEELHGISGIRYSYVNFQGKTGNVIYSMVE